MKRKGIILTISIFIFVVTMMAWGQIQKHQPNSKIFPKAETKPIIQVLSISKVRGPERMSFINKQITIEGFYYDGSIPMVIDDIKRVYVDTPLPPESYIPIVGPKPMGLKVGDKISITGTLLKPTPQDHPSVQGESVIIRIEKLEQLKILTPSSISFRPLPEFKPYEPPVDLPGRYAVLIAGGVSPANNHVRYWNDL
ncbi:MAG: hypothetical protein ABIL70_09735 [candidate division WOR-3 bacterium]